MSRLAEFREYLEDQGLSAKTVKTYVNAIARMPEDPLKLFTKPSLSLSSRHTYRAALVQWADFTENDELSEALRSPATRRKLAKIRRGTRKGARKRVEPFTDEQIEAIHDVLEEWREDEEVPAWVTPALTLLIELGLRAGVDLVWLERVRLKDALAPGGKLEIISKGSVERRLPVLKSVRPAIEELVEISGWKYLSELISPHASEGNRADAAYQAVSRRLKAAAVEAGIDPGEVNTHRFRHTAADRLMRKSKGDDLVVRDFLGHSTVAVTHRYLGRDRTDDIARILEEDEE